MHVNQQYTYALSAKFIHKHQKKCCVCFLVKKNTLFAHSKLK